MYAAGVRGQQATLPALQIQYADFAAWQREQFTGKVLEAELAYWQARLAGAPPWLELPTDRPRPAVAGQTSGRARLLLPGALCAAPGMEPPVVAACRRSHGSGEPLFDAQGAPRAASGRAAPRLSARGVPVSSLGGVGAP